MHTILIKETKLQLLMSLEQMFIVTKLTIILISNTREHKLSHLFINNVILYVHDLVNYVHNFTEIYIHILCDISNNTNINNIILH